MFLKGWDATREILAYPPGTGPLAVYEKEEFFGYLDFAIKAVSNIMLISQSLTCVYIHVGI